MRTQSTPGTEFDFDLIDFLPYLLHQAAEARSLEFGRIYNSRYGMLRTEWQVLFHLGCDGDLTANEICKRAHLHKTKVSRAVRALERRRFLKRSQQVQDRRRETLSLTDSGRRAFVDLSSWARDHNHKIVSQFTETEQGTLLKCLKKLKED